MCFSVKWNMKWMLWYHVTQLKQNSCFICICCLTIWPYKNPSNSLNSFGNVLYIFCISTTFHFDFPILFWFTTLPVLGMHTQNRSVVLEHNLPLLCILLSTSKQRQFGRWGSKNSTSQLGRASYFAPVVRTRFAVWESMVWLLRV